MLTPLQNQNLPTKKHSRELVQFTCECGNSHTIMWKSFQCGNIKTCGKCEIFRWKKSGTLRFGQLKLITPIEEITSLNKKVLWLCDCGQSTQIVAKSVLNGFTKSCGCKKNSDISRNNLNTARTSQKKSATEWKTEHPELIVKNPQDSWSQGSAKLCEFQCKCGNVYKLRFFKHKPGISTCRKCYEIDIKQGNKAENFIYDGSKSKINKNSYEKDWFICKCGIRTKITISSVFTRQQKTCGKCSTKDLEWWQESKFGRLRATHPEAMTGVNKYSESVKTWSCDCGNTFETRVTDVVNGYTSSCGSCREKILDWYQKNEVILKSLTVPIYPEDFPSGGPKLTEVVEHVTHRASLICWLCSREYKTRFIDLVDGSSLSCGCVSGKISKQNFEMKSFIKSLGYHTALEYEVNKMHYDVAVPNKKLLIEMQGLRWHSGPDSKRKDFEKAKNVQGSGWELVVIFEDEWIKRRNAVEIIIKNKLRLNLKSIRPSCCLIEKITSKEANEFYEKNHYIGKCGSSIHYGVRYEKQLIACASFGKPTRQSKYDFEITRMASNGNIRVHGIWSKVFKIFCEEYKPNSVVSFSDNRLFSGKVYDKLGFIKDGDVRSDYYWTKEQRRYHKSSLRKNGETETETEIRTSQGYKKIWDLGKIRWVFVKEREKDAKRKI